MTFFFNKNLEDHDLEVFLLFYCNFWKPDIVQWLAPECSMQIEETQYQ